MTTLTRSRQKIAKSVEARGSLYIEARGISWKASTQASTFSSHGSFGGCWQTRKGPQTWAVSRRHKSISQPGYVSGGT